MGEHGPHAPILGPDGLIYLMLGNHTFVEGELADTSPHHDFYDGELITPKYEDANGHASGIKAPGGSVVRTDTKGSFLELFVGGFRNAYDHAFNRDGELFTFDSDMEWDVALPWYRPTRVNHLIPGAEFGWRSGWSKWPAYYVDSLPALLDIGRGSPTGVVFYDHDRFPEKYHGAFFMCDWSQGRVLAVHMQRDKGTYRGESEIFLEGRPLNCSDIDVGPDGWLYICVGGRNTEGSILRVVADGASGDESAPAATGVSQAIRQPQLGSAWARRKVRDVKKQLGDQWGPALVAVAVNAEAKPQDRVRALDLMQVYGPAPASDLLVALSHDASAEVRSKATYLMGIHATEASNDRLVALLDDEDPNVPPPGVRLVGAGRSCRAARKAAQGRGRAEPVRGVGSAPRAGRIAARQLAVAGPVIHQPTGLHSRLRSLGRSWRRPRHVRRDSRWLHEVAGRGCLGRRQAGSGARGGAGAPSRWLPARRADCGAEPALADVSQQRPAAESRAGADAGDAAGSDTGAEAGQVLAEQRADRGSDSGRDAGNSLAQ